MPQDSWPVLEGGEAQADVGGHVLAGGVKEGKDAAFLPQAGEGGGGLTAGWGRELVVILLVHKENLLE